MTWVIAQLNAKKSRDRWGFTGFTCRYPRRRTFAIQVELLRLLQRLESDPGEDAEHLPTLRATIALANPSVRAKALAAVQAKKTRSHLV